MNAVTCLTWIKRGIAKAHPDKVHLTDEELSKLLKSSGKSKPSDNQDDDSDTEADNSTLSANKSTQDVADIDTFEARYNLDHYDDEDDNDDLDNNALGMGSLSFYESNQQDPYLKRAGSDSDEDSDDAVKPDDNLIALGKVNGDYFSLEVWISNVADGSLYCHHDAVLSNCPLAIEWIGYDPGDDNPLAGNLVAIGTMGCDIELWDIDVINTLEPAFILQGESKKTKKKRGTGTKKTKRSHGHGDAVLGLSWNHNRQTVLASASADESVGIWDLTTGTGVSFFRNHKDKVQAVQWHPVEDQLLLSGCYDGCVRLFDCRTASKDPSRIWSVGGEIEKVIWNRHNPFFCFAGTDAGVLSCFDVRQSSPIYTYPAHTSALTTIVLSPSVENCLLTASNDRSVKLWDLSSAPESTTPRLVSERHCKIGAIYCGAACPEESLIVCVGGEREMKVLNFQKDSKFIEHFVEKNTDASNAESSTLAPANTDDTRSPKKRAKAMHHKSDKLGKNRKMKSKRV